MKLFKKVSFLVAVLVLFTSFISGCTNGSKERLTYSNKDVYTIADSTGDWGLPTPYTHYVRGPGYIRMSLVYDTLIWKDKTGFPGALAKEWTYIEEDTAYLFVLREDVTWHDGKKFTAKDVLFTFDYVKKHPYPWVDTSNIKNVEATGEFMVKVYLHQPYAPFLANIAGTLPILPEHVYKEIASPKEINSLEVVVGTGPFKLRDYNRTNGTYLFEANENYYLGSPKVKELKFIKVGSEMLPHAILDGTANAGNIPADLAARFKDEGYTVLVTGNDWNAKLIFNHKQEPFTSKEFRQALAYAINRDKLVAIAQRGHAVAGSPGLLPPDSPWYSADINKYEYNPDKSREIFQEMGYNFKDGFLYKDSVPVVLELLFSPTSDRNFDRDAELIKADLEKVGIQVLLRGMEAKTVDTKIQEWNFQMALSGHGGLGGDPQSFNKFVLADDFNSVRYMENEELTKLLNIQLVTMDEEKRKAVLAEIQKIYADELPALTLYYPYSYFAHDGWMDLYYTPGGIAIGVPIALNKLSFIE